MFVVSPALIIANPEKNLKIIGILYGLARNSDKLDAGKQAFSGMKFFKVCEPRLLSSPHTTNIDFSRVRLTFVVHLSGIEIYNPRRMNIFGWNRGRPERAGVA